MILMVVVGEVVAVGQSVSSFLLFEQIFII
jgi:hypothetical protein